VWSVEQVKDNLREKKVQVIDARGKARFDGSVPEPRKGVRGGHIPGSKCVPFPEVLSPSGTLLSPEEIGLKFENAGRSSILLNSACLMRNLGLFPNINSNFCNPCFIACHGKITSCQL
jgi:hypothetical protein